MEEEAPCGPHNMAHRIEMLGTGNAFLPHGRHHSFALFDGHNIIDAPRPWLGFAAQGTMLLACGRCSSPMFTGTMSLDSLSPA